MSLETKIRQFTCLHLCCSQLKRDKLFSPFRGTFCFFVTIDEHLLISEQSDTEFTDDMNLSYFDAADFVQAGD